METVKINNTILEYNKIIYVDAVNGSDETGDGSEINPYKTLLKSINQAQSNYCIRILNGKYQLPLNTQNIYLNKSISFIGNGLYSIINGTNIKAGTYWAYLRSNIKFYNIKFETSYFFNASDAGSLSYVIEFHNCLFVDVNKLSSSYMLVNGRYGSLSPNIHVDFLNCAFNDFARYAYGSSSQQTTFTNCAFNNSPDDKYVNQANIIMCLTNVLFDNDYHIISDSWEHTGNGTNPDGTQANIGIYGGEFSLIRIPQSIDKIIYNVKEKSVGDIASIRWSKSDGATRYELQYFQTEWITISNNIISTEYIYTFLESNPTAQFRVRGVNDEGESDWIVGEVFGVTNQFSMDGEIIIKPQNKMRGFINITGYGEDYLDSSLIIKQGLKEDLDSIINITEKYDKNEIDGSLTVAVKQEISLDSSIFLNPSGRMRGYIDIVQPSKRVKKIYPVKDSVVRQSAPTINYGDSQQMLVGKSVEGKFISYLGFELELPNNIDIESVNLVLNKQYKTSEKFLAGLYETSDNWDEYDITWDFRPYDENYITQFFIPVETGKVEIDITDFGWDKGKKSFIIESLDYNVLNLAAFGTRESFYPPYIEVTYYETVDNAGSYFLDSNISVKGTAVRDINAIIDVISDHNYRELDGFLEINKKIVQKELKSIITVKELRQVYLGGELEIKKKYQKIELSSSMIIPYKEFLGATLNIEKKNRNTDLNSSIYIKAYNTGDLDGLLSITSKNCFNDLDSSIVIGQKNIGDLNSSLDIKLKNAYSDKDAIIVVRRTEKDYLEAKLLLEKKYEYPNIDGVIVVRKSENTELNSTLKIPEYNKVSEIGAELYILFRSFIDSTLEVPKIDSRAELSGKLEIQKYFCEEDIDAFMVVKVFWVSELDSFIDVRRDFEIDGDLIIKKKSVHEDLSASIFVDVGGDYVFIM